MDTNEKNIGGFYRMYLVQSLYVVVFILVIGAVSVYPILKSLDSPPEDFPINTEIVIAEGLTHSEIAELLSDMNVIKSTNYMYLLLENTYSDRFVKAGTYIFEQPRTSKEIVDIIVNGYSENISTRVTFPEGFNALTISEFLPEVEITKTNEELRDLNGYLFPDTYFISKEMTFDEILLLMRENFDKKIKDYETEIENSPFTLEEVITLASIIEREAGGKESKRIVSGILLNRLDINMALQVDAVFDYLLDKESSELTEADLTMDSPYNTYLYTGLPPTPIANPGIDSIEAVFNPIKTDYLYYLTAPDGTFYYAETFEEHKVNKRNHLR